MPELPVVLNGVAPVSINVGLVAPKVNDAFELLLFAVTGIIDPATVRVPLVSVKEALLLVPPGLLLLSVRWPLTFRFEIVEVMEVVAVLVGVTTVPTLIFAQVMEPAPARVIALPAPALLVTVMSPDTVSVVEALTERLPVLPEKVTEAHAALAETVTVLAWMLTISPSTGYMPDATAPPPDVYDQVVLAFHAPVAIDQNVAFVTVIVMSKVVDPLAFAAVTVYVVAGVLTIGMPLITPVVPLMVRPAGRAGLTE